MLFCDNIYSLRKLVISLSRQWWCKKEGNKGMGDTIFSPPPPRCSLSVSPIEGLGSSAHSFPCKDSAPHILHPSLNPPLFSSRLEGTAPVSHLPKNDHSLPPKADHSHLSKIDHSLPPKIDHSHQTRELSKMEGLVIRHRDDGKVAKETGLPVQSEGRVLH